MSAHKLGTFSDQLLDRQITELVMTINQLVVDAVIEAYYISEADAEDLTNGGDSSLHYHSADRARANHTGTQLAATISDFAAAVAAASTKYGTFTNASLSAGVLTITHTFDNQALHVTVRDQLNNRVTPDVSFPDASTVEIDLSGWGTITGTWAYRISL